MFHKPNESSLLIKNIIQSLIHYKKKMDKFYGKGLLSFYYKRLKTK